MKIAVLALAVIAAFAFTGGIAVSQNVVGDEYLIVPGERIGNFKLADTFETIRDALGPEFRSFPAPTIKGATSHFWGRSGWVVFTCDKGGAIPSLGFYRRKDASAQAELEKYQTAGGVRLNSAFVDVIKEFGDKTIFLYRVTPQGSDPFFHTSLIMGYEAGMYFEIHPDNVVRAIFVNRSGKTGAICP